MDSPPFEAPPIEALADLLPGYDFELLIGQGAMGAVYQAHQQSLDRKVAIKILPRELGEDPGYRESFETEARAMARLNHANLISVYDCGTADGLLYIVMEFVPGKSLHHSAHQRRVDPEQAVDLVIGICRGLAHAHETGIIHRDVKPANILLTPKRQPKLGDFGLARPAGDESDGLAMGTPGYTAPEVIRHPERADRRSDIFAVGVILYELLTGSAHRPRCQPPSKVADTDPRLDKIWGIATNPDPEKRYPDADVMADALKAWRKKHKAAPKPLVSPAAQRPVSTTSSTTPPRRKRTPVTKLLIIAVLLLATGIAWQKLQQARQKGALAVADKAPDPVQQTTLIDKSDPAVTGDPPEPLADPDDPPPPPDRDPETPAQSLVRLREQLAGGGRDKMPAGTVQHAGCAFFLVGTPMTWDQATRFAKSYGGHLPLVTGAEDLAWLASQVPAGDADSGLWIGANRLDDDWRLIDGSTWPLPDPPAGSGDHLSVRDDGAAQALPSSELRRFLIQWQPDGSQPGALRPLLARTRASLATDKPLYPPSAKSVDGRHFLVITEAMTSEAARELAEHGGGHLAVPGTGAEADWIDQQLAALEPDTILWLGARRHDAEWKWDTGEAWTYARWDPASPSGKGTVLAAVGSRGWVDAHPSDRAGFIIEWSDDHKSPVTPPALDRPADLQAKAGELLADLDKKRRAALAANIEDFDWQLNVWRRSLPKDEEVRWIPGIQRIKTNIRDDRLPSNLPTQSSRLFHQNVLKIARANLEKQTRIEDGFVARCTRIRDAYARRLEQAREKLQAVGQLDLARQLDEAIAAATDLDAWITGLGAVSPSDTPELAQVRIIKATYGSGGNQADVTARVTKLVEVEKKSFWANPGNLGADPCPGWNKHLSIVFEFNGVKKTKGWGENSKITMEAFTGQ